MTRAAQAGISGAWRLLRLTPREIEWEFEAHAAREANRARQGDLEAWFAGRYVMLALHAPKKYPRQPDLIRPAPRVMTPEDMKQVFSRIAEKRGDPNGNR